MSVETDLVSEGTEESKPNNGVEDHKQVEQERMEKFMKNMSRLSLVFGSSIILGIIIAFSTSHSLIPEVVVQCMLVGAFMIASSLITNKIYGFTIKKLMPAKISSILDTYLRIRSDEEAMAELPRAYLALSGLALVADSAAMIAGDILINNLAYREVPQYIKGGKFVFFGCTVIFITAACLSFAMTMLTSTKHLNKSIVICFFLGSLAGAVAATYLNFTFKSIHFSSIELNRQLMQKDLQGSYIKGQTYPSANIFMWLVMKFASAEIIMVFSFYNILLPVTLFLDIKGGIKEAPSVLLGVLGIVMIVSGLALEVMLNLLITSNIMASGYRWLLEDIRPIVAIFTLIAGIHAFHAFYSAGKLHKLIIFVFSLSVIVSSIFAGIAVMMFHADALEVETAALTPCPMNPDDDAHFCVYNTTEIDRRIYDRWNPDGDKRLLSPLACISREKFCDGKADLFVDKMEDYYNRVYHPQGYKLFFCGDTLRIHGVPNPAPMDEVACYTPTVLPLLVMAAIIILAISVTCAFISLAVTFTSLPPTILFVLSVIKWLLSINSNDNEDEAIE